MAMRLYALASNCVHYVGTMSRPFISGINWVDLETVARLSRIHIGPAMMKRMRKIESLVIKESVEDGRH